MLVSRYCRTLRCTGISRAAAAARGSPSNHRRLLNSTANETDDTDALLTEFLRRDNPTLRRPSSPLFPSRVGEHDPLRSSILDDYDTFKNEHGDMPRSSSRREVDKFFQSSHPNRGLGSQPESEDGIPNTRTSDDEIIILDHIKLARSQLRMQQRNRKNVVQADDVVLEPEVINKNASELLVKRQSLGLEDLMASIDLIQPRANLVSKARYTQLQTTLSKSFKKDQLVQYCRLHVSDTDDRYDDLVDAVRKKEFTIHFILQQIWGIKVSADVTKDLLTQKDFVLNEQRDMVLLLASDAEILRDTAKKGVDLRVGSKKNAIEITGPQDLVEHTIVKLEHILANVVESTTPLGFMNYRADLKISDIPVATISRLSQTCVEIKDRSDIRISALRERRMDIARRLIISSLKLYPQEKETLFYQEISPVEMRTSFYPMYLENSMPWDLRNRQWQRWRTVSTKKYGGPAATMSDFILEYPILIASETEKLLSRGFRNMNPATDFGYRERLTGFESDQQANSVVANAIGKLLHSIVDRDGLGKDSNGGTAITDFDLRDPTVHGSKAEAADVVTLERLRASESGPNELLNVFKSLDSIVKEEKKRKALDEEDEMVAMGNTFTAEDRTVDNDVAAKPSAKPEYTVVFGSALHQEQQEQARPATSETSQRTVPKEHYMFLAHTPVMTRFIDTFGTAPENEAVEQEMQPRLGQQLTLIPNEGSAGMAARHYYVLKFAASPYAHPQCFAQYAAVDIVIPADAVWQPRKEEAQVQVREEEHAVDAFLPAQGMDIRFRRRVLGQVLAEQHGVQAFLEELKIQLRQSRTVKIPPTMEVQLGDGGETVTYLFRTFEQHTELRYRRGDHILTYDVVEGGILDGRRVESTMMLDPARAGAESKEHDEEELQQLVRAAVEVAAGASLLSQV
ncbi:mitochondrial inner-membrane-bound regulator-domain-containing protein [Limtongia smithiae]|uniref:mitochondrial inner-membrane-bound regulator-domain-containing protein n=1 Tax=Limtongia smithiae TaxID=1125753 RepID=UPI0034CD69A1